MTAGSPSRPAGGTTEDLTSVRTGWEQVLTRLASDSRVAWTAFHAAAPVSLTGGVLAVAVAEPGNVRAIAQRGHDERLRQAIIDTLGLDVRIDVLHDPDAASGGRPAPAAAAGATPDARTNRAPRGTGRSAAAVGGPGNPGSGEAPPAGPRGSDLVRAAAAEGSDTTPEPADEPSADDPDLDAAGGDGLALITRELGARPIGAIDHS